MTIGPARPGDYAGIEALLREHRLPEAGLRSHLETTLVARDAGRIVGCAALELYGRSALLRSVAVNGPRRGSGLGRALTHAALELARARGVETVYLLTETAASFFARLGFREISRDTVAPAVRQSVEFVSACPATASCMALDLVTEPRSATASGPAPP